MSEKALIFASQPSKRLYPIYPGTLGTQKYMGIPEISKIPRNTRKYPRVKKIPENTRSYISTLLPDPNPTRYPVFFPIPDPTRPDIEKPYPLGTAWEGEAKEEFFNSAGRGLRTREERGCWRRGREKNKPLRGGVF